MNDFEICLNELNGKGYSGIAILIDEADCLGRNIPLLQMFRNVFQVVERCSLLLAGTEAVFPALSDVFSPIPRQFHRIDIRPFANWHSTFELVYLPLHDISDEIIEKIVPSPRLVQELHDLCGGAPDEIQLYCHHMYRNIEECGISRMALSPKVFREVLKEYRSNTTGNIDAVIKMIERLPNKLLFESNWLSRRSLSLDENIKVAKLRKETQSTEVLTDETIKEIENVITNGYNELYSLGITEHPASLNMIGLPLTAGFWKSFVEVEKKERWTWDDNSFAFHLRQPILFAIGRNCKALPFFETSIGDDIEAAVNSLRTGEKVKELCDGFDELIVTCSLAREAKSTYVFDCLFNIESPAENRNFQCRFFENSKSQIDNDCINKWISENIIFLEKHGIKLVLCDFRRWEIPSNYELHRLGRISSRKVPKEFGPSELERAVNMFSAGDTKGCMDMFVNMLSDKEEAVVHNNLAFCQILTGVCAEGLINANKAVANNPEPLYLLNLALANYLCGNHQLAIENLLEAYKVITEDPDEYNKEVSYVLILDESLKSVNFFQEITVDVAIIFNLWRFGVVSFNELEEKLKEIDSQNTATWLERIVTKKCS